MPGAFSHLVIVNFRPEILLSMFPEVTWGEIALRLLLTALGAAIIGFERESTNRPAGLRTTLLVGLAACVAMIQTNLLLAMRGKAADSFVVLDLMRLPLGILSGMGFIGAGAILRKNNLVIGVTTAATLWFVTVMGLCFGGGQTSLGLTAAALGIVVLRGLKWIEARHQQHQRGSLSVMMPSVKAAEAKIISVLHKYRCSAVHWSLSIVAERKLQRVTCDVHWLGASDEERIPSFLLELSEDPEILEMDWKREGALKDA